jgi:hypothetical protein
MHLMQLIVKSLFVVSEQFAAELEDEGVQESHHVIARARNVALKALEALINQNDGPVRKSEVLRTIPELREEGAFEFVGDDLVADLVAALNSEEARVGMTQIINHIFMPFARVAASNDDEGTDFSNLSGRTSSYTGVKTTLPALIGPTFSYTHGLTIDDEYQRGPDQETAGEVDTHHGNENNDDADSKVAGPFIVEDEGEGKAAFIIEKFKAGEISTLAAHFEWEEVFEPVLNSLLFVNEGNTIAGQLEDEEWSTMVCNGDEEGSSTAKENSTAGNNQPRSNNGEGRNALGEM